MARGVEGIRIGRNSDGVRGTGRRNAIIDDYDGAIGDRVATQTGNELTARDCSCHEYKK
jgi:hypothetical protein